MDDLKQIIEDVRHEVFKRKLKIRHSRSNHFELTDLERSSALAEAAVLLEDAQRGLIEAERKYDRAMALIKGEPK